MAVFVAGLSIWWHRHTTKQENTIKLLMKDLNDDLIKEGIKLLESIDNDSIDIYANSSNRHKKETVNIRNLLNYYEMVSVGANKGIYDIKMIKQAQKTIITKIYQHSELFIKRVRKVENNNNLYIEFETFVEKLKE
ncbi:hypothetical protein MNB_SUP05-5-851 [hydrothermal vent metagenome]|uniref:Uncharacterized protein n=1 Tax=hydrothermal vent metagenome TaxID=652676 RepID=A0A1W1CM95_9ZZZZ